MYSQGFSPRNHMTIPTSHPRLSGPCSYMDRCANTSQATSSARFVIRYVRWLQAPVPKDSRRSTVVFERYSMGPMSKALLNLNTTHRLRNMETQKGWTAHLHTPTHLFGKADNRGLDGADAAPHRRRLDLNQLRRAGAVIRRQVLHQELKRRASPPQHRERGTNTGTRCGRENVREAAQRLR